MEKMSFIEEKKSFLEKILAKTRSNQLTRNLFLELGNDWVIRDLVLSTNEARLVTT